MRFAGRRGVMKARASRDESAEMMWYPICSLALVGLMLACAIVDAIPVGRAHFNALRHALRGGDWID